MEYGGAMMGMGQRYVEGDRQQRVPMRVLLAGGFAGDQVAKPSAHTGQSPEAANQAHRPVEAQSVVPDGQRGATISPYEPSWREKIRYAVQGNNAYHSGRGRLGRAVEGVLSEIPGFGTALSANDYARSEPGSLDRATAAMGMLPVPGAARGARAIGEGLQGMRQLYKGGYREPTTELMPNREVNWPDFEGKVMIPTPGDLTATGQRITGTPDGDFSSPVDIQGGRYFGRGDAARMDNSGWASTKIGATGLHNRIQKVANETNMDPVLAYMPLGHKSSDFTLQGWRVYDQLLQQRGGEAAMPALSKDLPFGPSLASMREWYEGTNGTTRSKVFKQLEGQRRLKASGVHPDEVRNMIRDPGLENAREGDIGYGFILPDGRLTSNTNYNHADYSHHMGGNWSGELAPQNILGIREAFPSAFAQNPHWNDLLPHEISQSFKTAIPYERITPEYVERQMKAQERRLREGR